MIFTLFACAAPPPPPPAVQPVVEAAPAPSPPLGEDFTAEPVIPVDTLLAQAADWTGKEVVVEATVKEVCQKKGCWHTLATASPDVAIMVRDKEYKIFLPKDAAGKRVQVRGTFAMVETPEDEARHLAEDAGRDPSTVVGPQKGYQIDAAGVKFVPEPAAAAG